MRQGLGHAITNIQLIADQGQRHCGFWNTATAARPNTLTLQSAISAHATRLELAHLYIDSVSRVFSSKMFCSVLCILTFQIGFLSLQSSAADAQQWRSRSIYQACLTPFSLGVGYSTAFQVMTDRFALQDVSDGTAYNVPCNTSALQYCGGTWRGIIDHLDYIQGMGFDAIWISPPFSNVEGQTPMGEAYHGCVCHVVHPFDASVEILV